MKKETKTIIFGSIITIIVLILAIFLLFFIYQHKDTSNKNTSINSRLESNNVFDNQSSITEEEIDTTINQNDEIKMEDSTDFNQSSILENEDEKVIVYIFRGEGCPHCEHAIQYFKSILSEYNYLEVKSLEIWYQEDNYKLAKDIASKFGIELKGVPFIVIGNYKFSGFSTSMDEEIKKVIQDAYQSNTYQDIVQDTIIQNHYQLNIENLKN